jgi:hypothetical protein
VLPGRWTRSPRTYKPVEDENGWEGKAGGRECAAEADMAGGVEAWLVGSREADRDGIPARRKLELAPLPAIHLWQDFLCGESHHRAVDARMLQLLQQLLLVRVPVTAPIQCVENGLEREVVAALELAFACLRDPNAVAAVRGFR